MSTQASSRLLSPEETVEAVKDFLLKKGELEKGDGVGAMLTPMGLLASIIRKRGLH